MKISPPSIPFHVSRAYGVQTRTVVQPVAPVARQEQPGAIEMLRRPDGVDLTGEVQSVRPSEAGRAARLEKLVAAEVPGGVRFTENGPEPTTNAADLRSADAIRAAVEGRASSSRADSGSASIPMYRNPAMKNAAAASIAVSRSSLDVSG
jgi:hypothetical protein